MKILQVRFKNLNSLAGEWNIDFTDPAYSEDGIFAITGPTGSGKTTILDAICLALYGRTPRLDSISASSNEIMTRQTGDCFSEVVFSTASGRYRCYWCQRRSHNKADGKLQAATREFVDDKTGVVLEQKLKTVSAAVIEKTGMTFDQFTRSMLLAQGGFAAFLQAPPDERAPILEQITGTEIYSRISIKVHEMRGEQRAELEKLQAANSSIQLLSEEAAADLNAQVADREAVKKAATERKQKAQMSLAWLDRISALEVELAELDQRWAELEKRRAGFAADQRKLEWAEKARGLQWEWAQLIGLRQQFAQDSDALAAAEAQLPETEEQFKAARIARDAAKAQVAQLRNDQKTAAGTIRAVRALDLRIDEQRKSVLATEVDLQTLAAKIAEADARREMLETKIKAESERVQQAADYLSAHAPDKSLPEHLAALRGKFQDLAARFSAETQALEKRAAVQGEFEKQKAAQREKAEAHGQHERCVQSATQKITNAAAALDRLLEGRDPAQIQQELDECRTRNRLLVDLQTRLQDLGMTELEISAKRTEKAEIELSLGQSEADLISAETERDHCEEHLHSAEVQLELIRRMAGMEEQRRRLMDGHPCPLCGSTDHPFVVGKMPQPNKAEAAVADAKLRFGRAQAAVVAVEKQLLLIGQSGQQLRRRIAELKDKRAVQQQELETVCNRLSLAVKKVTPKGVNGLLAESTCQMDEYVRRVESVNQALKEKAAAQVAYDAEQAAFRQSEIAVAEAAAAAERQALLCDQAQSRVAEISLETAALQTALLARLEAYGITVLSEDVFDQLDVRCQAWKTAQDKQAQGQLMLAGLQKDLNHEQADATEKRALQAAQQQQLSEAKNALTDLQEKRHELFAEKDADSEESVWSQRVEAAERELESAAQDFADLDKKREALISESERLNKLQHNRVVSISQQEQDFAAKMTAKGFADEVQYQSALLSEEEYAVLAESAEVLKKEGAEIAALREHKTAQRNAERAEKMTGQSREEVAEALQLAAGEESVVAETIGGLRQKLKDDAQARAKCAGQLEQIAAQQKLADRWDRLHALIGSGDGKKFRNFAQGLTFELVIAQANRQLRKMSDRYLLVHDGKQPLDLNVIDDYQGGEIRSTKNLSGGESFIVSLALALGLSHMASRNVRVDSLFLDEGFGTLDEDALATALETLAGLQEEGKLIGVISHVPQLKERIRTQIQIEPQPGGRSVICGAGCVST